jgi:excinuclease ABC subunit C
MKKVDLKKFNLPKNPGVYFFFKGREILYIGKATSLNDRVRSYFSKDLIETRGPMILDMVTQSTSIKFQSTDTVLEALILESNLIKKHQPKYNTKEKDNKSFNYVCITDEQIPKVIIERGRSIFITKSESLYKKIFGPFPNGLQLREAMKIIRRIFPYVDEQSSKKNNVEFYKQLGLMPDMKEFSFALVAYRKNIQNLILFFQGKKKNIISNLKKEMMDFAKKKEFERANIIKKRIFALNHINDVALIKEEGNSFENSGNFIFTHRIEAYDIAHMLGKDMVGVMVVMEDGDLSKKEYRKFIIRRYNKANDTGSLAEVLERRFLHLEWKDPNLIVVDGGLAQVNKARAVLKKIKKKIPVVSVLKDDKHKAKAIIGDEKLIQKNKKDILLINSESHRFAIAYHKLKRGKSFLA